MPAKSVKDFHSLVMAMRAGRARYKRTGTRQGARGERHPKARLTASQVRAMREWYTQPGISHGDLAAAYGVSKRTVSDILTGKTWGHVQ